MDERNCFESQYALHFAFQTMKERCQQLQTRLVTVEKENISLRQQYEKNKSMIILRQNEEDLNIIEDQQEKIEELKNQKSQLAHHIFMVSSENQQLWKRLIQLIRTNKSSGDQLKNIYEILNQNSLLELSNSLTYNFKEMPDIFMENINYKDNLFNNEENENSLQEISVQIFNNSRIEKSEIAKQHTEIADSKINTEINNKNIDFIYALDTNVDSMEQLKNYDSRLTEIKEELLCQQYKLKNALCNLKTNKKNATCNNCKNNAGKLMTQIDTQFDKKYIVQENISTQTSIPIFSLIQPKNIQISDDENICPLCGVVYNISISFEIFHEHVLNHFITEAIGEF